MLEHVKENNMDSQWGPVHTKCTFVCSALTGLGFVRKQINRVKGNGKKPKKKWRQRSAVHIHLFFFLDSSTTFH
jgi:hypothetical protein